MKDVSANEIRTCPKCKESKIIEGNYYWTKRDGWYTYCINCTKAQNKLRTPEIRRKWHIKSAYGIDYDTFESMLNAQGGKCKICENTLEIRTGGFAVDHSHTSNKVRAILCTQCNTALGHAKDDISILEKMISYLKTHSDAN